MEAESYDLNLRAHGYVVAMLLAQFREDAKKQVRDILDSERQVEELTNQITISSARNKFSALDGE